MAFDPFRLVSRRPPRARARELPPPLAAKRGESIQRLQIGFFGLGTMVLVVGLANIIMNSVAESQASAVPQASPTTAAGETPAPSRDPLVDAGVVPGLPVEPAPVEEEASRSIIRQPFAAPPVGDAVPPPQP